MYKRAIDLFIIRSLLLLISSPCKDAPFPVPKRGPRDVYRGKEKQVEFGELKPNQDSAFSIEYSVFRFTRVGSSQNQATSLSSVDQVASTLRASSESVLDRPWIMNRPPWRPARYIQSAPGRYTCSPPPHRASPG